MTIAREILNMFEFSRNKKNAFSIEIVILYRNKEVYPQINEPFRCIDMCNRKPSVVLWVHPFTLTQITRGYVCLFGGYEVMRVRYCMSN